MFKEKLEKILDDSFGMFLQDKDNPIYKNLRDEVVNNTASLLADELLEEKKLDHARPDFVSNNSDALFGYNHALKEVKTKLGVK